MYIHKYKLTIICCLLLYIFSIVSCSSVPRQPLAFQNQKCLELYTAMVEENRNYLNKRVAFTAMGLSWFLFVPELGLSILILGMSATSIAEYYKIEPFKFEWRESNCREFP